MASRLSEIKAVLLTSGVQQTNQPLWQAINQLLDYLIKAENDAAASGAGSGGSSAVASQILQLLFQELGQHDDWILIPGPRGLDGIAGLIGPPGQDGIDGEDAIPIPGPKGDTGLTGPPGMDGDCSGCEAALLGIPSDAIPAGSGTPGGADTEVQYNDGGAFAGDPTFVFDKTNKTLSIGADLVFSANAGIRRDTADGADDGFVALSAGGAINDSTRGASIVLTGNEFGSSLDGSIHLAPGNVANNATRIFRGAAGSAILEVNTAGDCTIRDAAGNVIAIFDATNRRINLDSGQIQFPSTQIPSSNANTLDDYEEGTWTPTLTSAGGGAPTYTTQLGTYRKIGKLVNVDIYIILATIGTLAAGDARISSLPFTSGSSGALAIGPLNWVNMTTTAVFMGATVLGSLTSAVLVHAAASAASVVVTQIADLSGTWACRVSISYEAAA